MSMSDQGAASGEQVELLQWLADPDRTEWDAQIERDFSDGGAGMALLERVNAQIDRGATLPMNSPPNLA